MSKDFDDELEKTLAKARKLSGSKRPEAQPKKKAEPSEQKPAASKEADDKKKSGAEDVVEAARTVNKLTSKFRGATSLFKGMFNKASKAYEKAEPVAKVVSTIFNYATLGLLPAAKWAGKKYCGFVFNQTLPKDPETNLRGFSKNGLFKSFALTASIWFAGIPAAKFGAKTTQQGVMQAVSGQTQFLYLTDSDMIEEGVLYSVSATKELPADGDTTIQFHIEQDFWHMLWRPEELYSAIPEEISFAIVDSNGFRIKYGLNLYPEIKDLLVFPITSLPQDHPAHTGDEVTAESIRDYLMIRLPEDHPAHDGAELTRQDMKEYMMRKPLLAPSSAPDFSPK